MKTDNKPAIDAFEPAFWAFLCGASTITSVHTMSEPDVTPLWLKVFLIITMVSVAAGSAYKTYNSANKLNKQIKNLKDRQR